MTRFSNDYRDPAGNLIQGFDYELQTWVKGSIVQDCGHPASMSGPGRACCRARKYAGINIVDARRMHAASERARSRALRA